MMTQSALCECFGSLFMVFSRFAARRTGVRADRGKITEM